MIAFRRYPPYICHCARSSTQSIVERERTSAERLFSRSFAVTVREFPAADILDSLDPARAPLVEASLLLPAPETAVLGR